MRLRLLGLACVFLLVVGLALAASAGPTPGGADGDGDTVEDAFDNCTEVVNPGQEDADHDGCGDACDPELRCDLNGDGKVGTADYLIMSGNWGSTTGGPGDCNEDGDVGTPDFVILSNEWGLRKGPSGIANPSRDYDECP